MDVPNWWEAALLAVAAWRTFQLIAYDTILDQPRHLIFGLGRKWKEGDRVPETYREYIPLFVECPYCAGFWIALGWWGAWQIWPHGTLVAATVGFLSAGVIALAKVLTTEDDK
jgi:hypothetical protein